jgi:hypothetical protein
MISEGASPKAVCDMLGHSSIRITMDRYGHLYAKDKEALAAKIDAVYRTTTEDSPNRTTSEETDTGHLSHSTPAPVRSIR